MAKERIDKLLYDLGFAGSRSRAAAMVMAGIVLANEKRVEKPSEKFEPTVNIRIKGQTEATKYVGRGGLKLEAALREFSIDPTDLNCIDIGSSTGGFTDCLLQNGASRVLCIDSGTNQLAWKIRSDPRVEVRENTNARNLRAAEMPFEIDLAVMDVSFISVTKIFPAIADLLKKDGKLVVLIKPQFEVGKGEVGKGGIVRDTEKHLAVIEKVRSSAESFDLRFLGIVDSPILGAEGNKEFLALFINDR